jgi:hypothetical protein
MSRNINKAFHALMATLGALAIGVMLAPNAIAGCADIAIKPGNAQLTRLRPVAYRVASESGSSADNPEPGGADIVGMWKFSFVVKNSVGGDIVADWGFTQWHSDGTEITNSAARSPATQNFCLGVWKKVGPSTYKLNHQALNYDAGGTLLGLAVIGEQVTVDKTGNAYSGTFSIDVFDTLGHNLFHLEGQIYAVRITVD